MFKFRSGANGLNEEPGRHQDDRRCKLCGDECESVVHVLCTILLEIHSWKT